MKRIWMIVIGLVGLQFQSNAQTTIPFYGFELSNYEVGDTLEYYRYSETIANSWSNGSQSTSKIVIVIIGKDQVTSDSVVFNMKQIVSGFGNSGYFEYIIDSAQASVTDTFVSESGNLILEDLYFDTSSAYNTTIYDTLDGAKHLYFYRPQSSASDPFEIEYELLQNIGIISYRHKKLWMYQIREYYLMYLHSANYGTYGTYEPLILSTDKVEPAEFSVFNNHHNKSIQILSNAREFSLCLYNAIGQKVLAASNSNSIYVGNLPTGIYFYQVVTDDQTASGKIWIR